MPRKKKPDEHLDVYGEFDAPSVLNLVNIAHEPKLTYEESHWQSMSEIERDESDAYRETEYSPDEDFEQNFDEAAWGEAEGDVDADTDIDSADSADSDTGSDADSDADSGTEYGIDSDFGGSDTSWDMGDWGSWGDFDIDYGDYS